MRTAFAALWLFIISASVAHASTSFGFSFSRLFGGSKATQDQPQTSSVAVSLPNEEGKEQPEKAEKAEQAEQPEQPQQPSALAVSLANEEGKEQPEQPEKAEKAEQAEQPEQPQQPSALAVSLANEEGKEQPEQPEKAEKAEQAEQPEQPQQPSTAAVSLTGKDAEVPEEKEKSPTDTQTEMSGEVPANEDWLKFVPPDFREGAKKQAAAQQKASAAPAAAATSTVPSAELLLGHQTDGSDTHATDALLLNPAEVPSASSPTSPASDASLVEEKGKGGGGCSAACMKACREMKPPCPCCTGGAGKCDAECNAKCMAHHPACGCCASELKEKIAAGASKVKGEIGKVLHSAISTLNATSLEESSTGGEVEEENQDSTDPSPLTSSEDAKEGETEEGGIVGPPTKTADQPSSFARFLNFAVGFLLAVSSLWSVWKGFSFQPDGRRLHYLTAVACGVSSLAYFAIGERMGVVGGPEGASIALPRYVAWVVVNPLMASALDLVRKSVCSLEEGSRDVWVWRSAAASGGAALFLLAGAVMSGSQRWMSFSIACFCLLVCVCEMAEGPSEKGSELDRSVCLKFEKISRLTFVCWILGAAVWALVVGGSWVDSGVAATLLFGSVDVASKGAAGFWLLSDSSVVDAVNTQTSCLNEGLREGLRGSV